ncbi:hypothetical protein [uncultured Pseudacidovorax sp.]|uniref:phage tail terminator protein n=1 Tax=uncultured Pseudacidovorax sp. TaxID=679313 RepID=UPI0025F5169E|nr:hypothetical protein [uncultured Pseudacidovorax sp.]
MNLDVIIAQLRAHAAVYFGQRAAGAAKFEVLPETANLVTPAAYVVPLGEQPDAQQSQTGYQQLVREKFAVVVALSNRADERGQASANNLHAARTALFRALLGFQPSADHDVIEFEGAQLLHLDRARLYYQFEFSAEYGVSTEDTWIPSRNAALPDFKGLDLRLDALDPFDPNTPAADFPGDPNAYAGGAAPDGRAEGGLTLNLPTQQEA